MNVSCCKKTTYDFCIRIFHSVIDTKKAMYEPPLFLEFFQKRTYKILKAMQSSNMY